uniref:Putative ovule protein n=1 Tax=Solanum chacoense TaxID=4108 RepID=A0A0V0GSQ7_SOLCH
MVVHQKGYLTNPIVICLQLWKSHQHSELHKMHCLCCTKSCLLSLDKQNLCTKAQPHIQKGSTHLYASWTRENQQNETLDPIQSS